MYSVGKADGCVSRREQTFLLLVVSYFWRSQELKVAELGTGVNNWDRLSEAL